MALPLIYQPINSSSNISQLLAQPRELLASNKALDKQVSQLHAVDEFSGFIHNALASNPLCLLFECIGTGCPLNRLKYPHLRAQFEQTVTEQVANQAQTAQPLVYVSLGSGSLLQDALLIGQFIGAGCNAITIHLIDSLYSNYICMQADRSLCNTQESLIFDKNIDVSTALYLAHMHEQFRQFIAAITPAICAKQDVGQTAHDITCYIYGSVDEYLLACAHNRSQRAHVGTLVDIDCPSLIRDMRKVVAHGLQPDGTFFYLDDSGITKKAV